jgi:hypothetical protein
MLVESPAPVAAFGPAGGRFFRWREGDTAQEALRAGPGPRDLRINVAVNLPHVAGELKHHGNRKNRYDGEDQCVFDKSLTPSGKFRMALE